ncbi:MAG: ankyrin repeat domain-containing protein [Novosphingobium sp.]
MPITRKLSLALAAILSAATVLPGPAFAQFSDSYKFLEAVRKRNDDDVQKLFEKNGQTIVNTRDLTTLDTPLHIAARTKNLRYVTFLISAGANVNMRNSAGETPLVIACNLGFIEAVEPLIAAGAKVDEPNSTGETPLITAVHNRNIALMRLLLQAGANADRKDNSGRSARDYAALDPKSETLLAEIKASSKAKPAGGKPVFGPN